MKFGVKPTQLALSAVIIFIPILILQSFYLKFRTEQKIKQWEKSSQLRKEESKESYQSLLDRQNVVSDNQTQKEAETKKIRPLTSTYNLHILLIKPSSLPDSAFFPLLNALQHSSSKYSNINAISDFLDEEAIKYESPEYKLNVILHTKSITLKDITKVGDIAIPWEKDTFGISNLQDEFEEVLQTEFPYFKEKDLVVFLYFDNAYEAGIDDSRFYEYKKFRSFADDDRGRAYVNVFSFSSSFASYLNEIILHESLHLFGATDKYLEDKYGCTEKGLGDIDKDPIYPQDKTDIMCGLVAKSAEDFSRTYLSDEKLVINPITAKEIGWKQD